jgi:hypothetical protein
MKSRMISRMKSKNEKQNEKLAFRVTDLYLWSCWGVSSRFSSLNNSTDTSAYTYKGYIKPFLFSSKKIGHQTRIRTPDLDNGVAERLQLLVVRTSVEPTMCDGFDYQTHVPKPIPAIN